MKELNANEIGIQELSVDEIEEVSGGILCLLVLAAAAGYGLGTLAYKEYQKLTK